MTYDEIKIIDDENTFGSDAVGIKEISLEQFRRCCVEGSREMTSAGKLNKVINGKYHEIDVPDQREVFFNSISMLKIIMVPYFKRDEDLKTEFVEIESSIEVIRKKYSKEFEKKEYKFNKLKFEQLKDLFYSDILPLNKRLLTILSSLLNQLNYFGIEGVTS